MRSREDHIKWCKERALAYLPGNPKEAVTSMLSDMNKHDETRPVIQGPIGMIGLMEATHGTEHSVRRFIEGFN